MTFQTTRAFMDAHGAMVTHDTILPGRCRVAATERAINMLDVCERICQENGLTMRELTGKRRNRRVSWPRQEAFFGCRNIGYSFQAIADFFDMHHTNVMHGCAAAEERMREAGALGEAE